MYVIVTIAGKQYNVSEGQNVRVASLDSKIGDSVTFNDVLLFDDGKKIKVGNPTVKNVSVKAKVAEHGRYGKVLVYKKKRRKGYQKKNGHRQGYTLLTVEKIQTSAPKKKTAAPKAKSSTKKTGDK